MRLEEQTKVLVELLGEEQAIRFMDEAMADLLLDPRFMFKRWKSLANVFKAVERIPTEHREGWLNNAIKIAKEWADEL